MPDSNIHPATLPSGAPLGGQPPILAMDGRTQRPSSSKQRPRDRQSVPTEPAYDQMYNSLMLQHAGMAATGAALAGTIDSLLIRPFTHTCQAAADAASCATNAGVNPYYAVPVVLALFGAAAIALISRKKNLSSMHRLGHAAGYRDNESYIRSRRAQTHLGWMDAAALTVGLSGAPLITGLYQFVFGNPNLDAPWSIAAIIPLTIAFAVGLTRSTRMKKHLTFFKVPFQN